MQLIQARHDATVGARHKSEKHEKKATELNADFERQMLDIRSAAAAERIRLVEQARRKAGELISGARTECQQLTETAEHETATMTDEVRAALKAEITVLAAQTASSVLGRDLRGNV